MAFKRSLAVLFLVAPSVLASPPPTTASQPGSPTCSPTEFWYPPKNLCLPRGGPKLVPSPPHGKSCPPDHWYWHREKSCCVPRHPVSPGSPPPQCAKHWVWRSGTQSCEPGHGTSTIHHHHHPSQIPKHGQDDLSNPQPPVESPAEDTYHQKRNPVPLCPRSLDACPVHASTGSEYECLDTTAELRSCGGCTSTGDGQDCTTIEGAWNVGCEAGSCAVYTCALGYRLATDGTHCIKN